METPDDLVPVVLDDAKPDQVVKVGAQLSSEVRTELAAFLREHKDVFAWTHADMPGIDPEIMVHRLNDDKRVAERVQPRRAFSGERYQAIGEEVDKLLAADFIREAEHPKWVSNVVMVKKPNGKWRICIDYKDLNKACPKDSFPLPRIEQASWTPTQATIRSKTPLLRTADSIATRSCPLSSKTREQRTKDW